jgi:predicted RNase H-like nuclease (RuvC/YqgF family)
LNLFKCENNSKNCEIEKLNSETLKLSNQIKEREMIYSDTIDKHEKQLLDKENVTKQYEIKVQELEHNIMEKKTEIENLRKVFS